MKPLAGQRVLVTRPDDQAAELVAGLQALGAEVVHLPTIRIAPPEDSELEEALTHLDRYAWVAFTSVNAVRAFFSLIEPGNHSHVRFAVVGARTAEAMLARGVRPELVAEPATSEVLVEQLLGHADMRGQRVLFPKGDRARDTLTARLRAAGAQVDDLIAYRTLPADEATRESLRRLLSSGTLDWITLTSPSAWQELLAIVGPTRVPQGVKLAAIGPTTAEAVRESGYPVTCEAASPSIQGLLDAIALGSSLPPRRGRGQGGGTK